MDRNDPGVAKLQVNFVTIDFWGYLFLLLLLLENLRNNENLNREHFSRWFPTWRKVVDSYFTIVQNNNNEVNLFQDSFICHVVSPMATAMREAGLLPILPGLEEPEMIINLRHNHTKWLHELEQLEGQQNSSGHGSDRSGLNNGVIEEEEESNKTESSLDTLQVRKWNFLRKHCDINIDYFF